MILFHNKNLISFLFGSYNYKKRKEKTNVEKVCPICGRSNKEVEFIGEFCVDCFLNLRKQNIPNSVEVKKCKKCNRIKVGKEWLSEKEGIEKLISKAIGFKFELKEIKAQEAIGFVYIEGKKINKSIKIKFIQTLCYEDFLKSSRYYEAKIQLRGEREKVEEVAKEIERNLLNTYILEKKEDKNGIDLLVGSRKEVEKTLKLLNLKPLVTFSLAGVKNGKRFYRATYSIRI
jgi:NMD protein affecting ribosome stability and mRNA decay